MGYRALTVIAAILLLVGGASVSSAADPWGEKNYDRLLLEEWFNVLFGESKIGFSTSSVEAGPEGYRLKGRAVIRLQVAGETHDLSFSQTFHLDKEKRVIGFVSLQNAGGRRIETTGRLEGTRLHLTVASASGEQNIELDLPVGIRFLETIAFTLADELKEGFDKTVPVYVTSLRAVEPIRIEVKGKERLEIDGREIEAWRATATMRGFVTEMWIDENGRTVREKEPSIGVVTQLTTKEKALAFADKGIPIGSLITYSLVKPDRALPHPGRIKRLSLLVGGLDTPRAIPRDERQSVGSPIWSDGPDGKRKLTLPVTIVAKEPRRILPLGELRETFPELLKPTPEVQSDHREIRNLAAEITRDAFDSWGAALAINRWVNENIEKELVDSFTALDVLHLKKGECQAHTHLFTALARAAGIPTTMAGGAGLFASIERISLPRLAGGLRRRVGRHGSDLGSTGRRRHPFETL